MTFDQRDTALTTTGQTTNSSQSAELGVKDTSLSTSLACGTQDSGQTQVANQTSRATFACTRPAPTTAARAGAWTRSSTTPRARVDSFNDDRNSLSVQTQQSQRTASHPKGLRDLTSTTSSSNTFQLLGTGLASFTTHREGEYSGHSLSCPAPARWRQQHGPGPDLHQPRHRLGQRHGHRHLRPGAEYTLQWHWHHQRQLLAEHLPGGPTLRPGHLSPGGQYQRLVAEPVQLPVASLRQRQLDHRPERPNTASLVGRTSRGTGDSFSDTNLSNYSSEEEQGGTDTYTLYSGVYTDAATGGTSYSGSKETDEVWSYTGHGSGYDNYTADSNGLATFSSFTDAESGSIDFSLDGGSLGSYHSHEVGNDGSTDFEHNHDWVGTFTLHAEGNRTFDGGGNPIDSLSDYLSTQSSLDTTGGTVGSGTGTLAMTSLTTVSGDDTGGTSSVWSYGTYTQPGSTENYNNGPTTSAVALSGAVSGGANGVLRLLQATALAVTPQASPGTADAPAKTWTEGLPGGPVGLVAGRLGAPA